MGFPGNAFVGTGRPLPDPFTNISVGFARRTGFATIASESLVPAGAIVKTGGMCGKDRPSACHLLITRHSWAG